MRDTFLLLWVGFLVVGVIGSIVSSIRKQTQQGQAARKPPRRIPTQWQAPAAQMPPAQMTEWVQRVTAPIAPPQPPRAAPRAVVPKPAPPAQALELPHDFPAARHPARPHLFRDRKTIVQAVIAAEVLGKPRALRDEYF
jgi:hypothetical protein